MASGILNVNKPPGMTSFSVVSRVRRLTGVRRVGHAGTLDPIAGGVLPICLGKATRIVEHLVDQSKVYRATVLLGVSTNTYDSEGVVTASADASAVSEANVALALRQFVGAIDQIPPMFSALKRDGRPLYEYARAGKTVALEPRRVHVYRIDLLRFEPPLLEIEVECGRGAYVRTLAHDFGRALDCGAHLSALTRLRSGPFGLEEAVSLEELGAAAERGEWESLLLATDRAIESWPAAILGKEHSLETRHGRTMELQIFTNGSEPEEPGLRIRAYSEAGAYLAILLYEGSGAWRPERVFDQQ